MLLREARIGYPPGHYGLFDTSVSCLSVDLTFLSSVKDTFNTLLQYCETHEDPLILIADARTLTGFFIHELVYLLRKFSEKLSCVIYAKELEHIPLQLRYFLSCSISPSTHKYITLCEILQKWNESLCLQNDVLQIAIRSYQNHLTETQDPLVFFRPFLIKVIEELNKE
jgi:hypothetical protein